MMILYSILFLFSLLLVFLSIYMGYKVLFALTMLHGPVFVQSADEQLKTMMTLPKIKKSARFVDLGSGDGKILLALAKKFPDAIIEGIEINPVLVKRSTAIIQKQNLTDRITIHRKSFWDVNLLDYDVVFLYGTSYIMKKLEKKVLAEMKPNSQLVSNYFKFPELKPLRSVNNIHLYRF